MRATVAGVGDVSFVEAVFNVVVDGIVVRVALFVGTVDKTVNVGLDTTVVAPRGVEDVILCTKVDAVDVKALNVAVVAFNTAFGNVDAPDNFASVSKTALVFGFIEDTEVDWDDTTVEVTFVAVVTVVDGASDLCGAGVGEVDAIADTAFVAGDGILPGTTEGTTVGWFVNFMVPIFRGTLGVVVEFPDATLSTGIVADTRVLLNPEIKEVN